MLSTPDEHWPQDLRRGSWAWTSYKMWATRFRLQGMCKKTKVRFESHQGVFRDTERTAGVPDIRGIPQLLVNLYFCFGFKWYLIVCPDNLEPLRNNSQVSSVWAPSTPLGFRGWLAGIPGWWVVSPFLSAQNSSQRPRSYGFSVFKSSAVSLKVCPIKHKTHRTHTKLRFSPPNKSGKLPPLFLRALQAHL